MLFEGSLFCHARAGKTEGCDLFPFKSMKNTVAEIHASRNTTPLALLLHAAASLRQTSLVTFR